ncbi:MAG: flavodoxin, partial [Clostridia bacterium]|nr:flavodoxin [Clostridia bacterium]
LRGRHIAAFACEGGSGAEKAFGKLQECLGIDTLAAKMILIDPKDRPKPDTEEKIGAFCDQIRAL